METDHVKFIYTDIGFEKIPPDAVVVSDCTVNYSQESDCCGPQDEHNHLKIHTEDGGGGMYMVIETKRWAINEIDELIAILQDFKTRSGMK